MNIYSTYIDGKEVFFKSLIECRHNAKKQRCPIYRYEIDRANLDTVIDILNERGIFKKAKEIENYEAGHAHK